MFILYKYLKSIEKNTKICYNEDNELLHYILWEEFVMAKEMMCYNIMIASPSDVCTERDLVEKVIHQWNSVNSDRENIILKPLRWEMDVALGINENVQEIINEDITNRSDLVVGVFHARLGSPSVSHASYTVEEIFKHAVTNRPVLLMFSKAPLPQNIDLEQVKRLRDFKKNLSKYLGGKNALYHDYESTSTFEQEFYTELEKVINKYLIGSQLNKLKPRIEDTPKVQNGDVFDVSVPLSKKTIASVNKISDSDPCLDYDGAFIKYYKVQNPYEKEEVDNLLEYLVKYGQNIVRPLFDSEIETFISRLTQNTFMLEIKGRHRDVFNLTLPFFPYNCCSELTCIAETNPEYYTFWILRDMILDIHHYSGSKAPLYFAFNYSDKIPKYEVSFRFIYSGYFEGDSKYRKDTIDEPVHYISKDDPIYNDLPPFLTERSSLEDYIMMPGECLEYDPEIDTSDRVANYMRDLLNDRQ